MCHLINLRKFEYMVGDIKDKLKASGGGNQEPQGDMKIFDSACSVRRP